MEHAIIPDSFYRVSVKGLILDDSRRFLLICSDNGHWDLPGGGLDFWETPEVALRREIREEMQLEIQNFEPRPWYFLTAKGMNKEFYVASIIYEITLSSLSFIPTMECKEIGFFNVEEAQNMDLYPKTLEFLKLYNPKNHVHH